MKRLSAGLGGAEECIHHGDELDSELHRIVGEKRLQSERSRPQHPHSSPGVIFFLSSSKQQEPRDT